MACIRPRFLIVNADDFGQSVGVTRGIVEAHTHGIVTSTSMMVHGSAASEAAAYARAHPDLSVGLHLDLAEWTFRNGEWVALYQRISLNDDGDDDDKSEEAIRWEIAYQLDRFRELIHRDPTHLDSHQHVHEREPVARVAREFAQFLNVPLRGSSPIRYCGAFYGQTAEGEPIPGAISFEGITTIIDTLSPGVTELACHPGYADDGCAADLQSMYNKERIDELRTLCDPRLRPYLSDRNVELRSFAGSWKAKPCRAPHLPPRAG